MAKAFDGLKHLTQSINLKLSLLQYLTILKLMIIEKKLKPVEGQN